MLRIWIYSFNSVLIVSLISFVGALALCLKEKHLKQILIYLVSFSAGALLSNAFFYLLPESTENKGLTLQISLYAASGIVFYFVVEKFIRFRHCHLLASKKHPHPLSLMVLWGDGVHNFIDGLIIGASFLASLELGWATSLAVVLHEIPQEIGDFGSLLYGGFSKRKALLFNFISALSAFLALFLIFFAETYLKQTIHFLIPFAAGGFIYIATADLIPELHKEYSFKTSLLQLFFLIIGILVMLALKKIQ